GPGTGWRAGPDTDTGLPLAYLRGTGLAAGSVEQARRDAGPQDAAGDGTHFAYDRPAAAVLLFRGKPHRVRTACTPLPAAVATSDDTRAAFDCHITLHDGDGRRSRLASMTAHADDDGRPRVGN